MARFRPTAAQALPAAAFQSSIRVYYEDTDAGGIVYHANYLRFFERVRTDWLRSLGVHQREIAAREQLQFVVRDMTIDFRSPARLDDLLQVDVRVLDVRRASLRLLQWARRDDADAPLVTAEVTVAAINPRGRPIALPDWLLARLSSPPGSANGQA
ncbi:MAG: tol-pal system-associated acyl-CoA thioesterase [Burkholderiaceae bacterium]